MTDQPNDRPYGLNGEQSASGSSRDRTEGEHLAFGKEQPFRPLRPAEAHPRSVGLTRTFGGTTLMRRHFAQPDRFDSTQGMADHLLIYNEQPTGWQRQRRGGRDREGDRPELAINLVPAREGFTWEWEGQPGQVSRHIYLSPAFVGRIAEEAFGIDRDRFGLRHVFDTHDDWLMHAISLLHRELDDNPWGASLGVGWLSQSLALYLARTYATRAPVRQIHSGRLSPKELADVEEYIEINLTEDITLEDLAAVAGLSVFHFTRKFKRTTGHTPHSYLIQRRVERAKGMLRDKALADHGIASIALACGFSDQSHLSRHFKRYVGSTPAQWRREG
ncbi:MAG: AraC family transcriptional regulator [Planctomycetota bacterium]